MKHLIGQRGNKPAYGTFSPSRNGDAFANANPEMEEPPIIETPTRCQRFKRFLSSSEFKLYCSYFLSAWGDRMWAFALSIALGVIGGDLQYTAASGLVNSVTVLLFASMVGRWVDKTPRLKAARTSLVANNSSVVLSAAILVVILFFSKEIQPIWNGGLSTLMISLSIMLCACSILANVATKICITKDWVIVISGSDKEELAGINAMMVRIDMAAMVLSPLLAGQVMSWFGTGWGCAFIGFWNIGSFFIEYYMLWAVYKSCPALAVKSQRPDQDATNAEHQEGVAESEPAEGESLTEAPADRRAQPKPLPTYEEATGEQPGKCVQCCSSLRTGAKSMLDAYRTYFHQSILPAGFALASLYLTVLSFDGVTMVYVLSLGMPENLIALCQGVSAIMGIVGSVVYPRLRRSVGLERTGLIALTTEWMFLLLPVASTWLPGSNFDPATVFSGASDASSPNCTVGQTWSESTTADARSTLRHAAAVSAPCINGTADGGSSYVSKCSLTAFITGIVLSRMGLWMADLSISQIFQENIAEHERGVVNGVQNSLNNVMNIVKSVLVIILPDPRTFGILIIISWLAVFAGYCSYCYYSWKKRGHLLPFHKHFHACIAKDGTISTIEASSGSEMVTVGGAEGTQQGLGGRGAKKGKQ